MARNARGKDRKSRAQRTGPAAASSPRRTGRGEGGLRFTWVNAIFGGAGVATVVAGYILLAQGSITAAPILLTLGYVVLLPIAIVK